MSSFQNSNIIAAAVGATIGVVSVAAVFIYHKVLERQQQMTMSTNIDKVNRKVGELQAEIEALRVQQANLQKRRRRVIKKRNADEKSLTGTEEVDIDTFSTYSTVGTDFGDDEFFDCSDEEELELETEGNMNENSELTELDKESEDTSLQPNVYIRLKTLLKEFPKDVEFIWRFARACYHCSLLEPKKSTELINEGLEPCERMLHVEDGNLYKWYAILTGVKSKSLTTKARIQAGYTFKEYVEKAIKLLPNDNYVCHLMGRFQYEVSTLSWFERKAAETLFAKVPEGSFESAITYFEKAEKLSKKPHYENKLLLAKCYINLGKYSEAVKWLKECDNMPLETMKIVTFVTKQKDC